jgi:hypothetical protein
MNRVTHFANISTPLPGAGWASMDDRQRLEQVSRKLKDGPAQFLNLVQVVAAKADGQVIVHLKQSLPASQRGSFLLDLEDWFREIDAALVVWLEPLGDRNSLRNLRGIEVKS